MTTSDGSAAPTRRLDATAVSGLPAGIARPAYDRNWIRTGMVHLGLGAFHRGHQAIAFDDCLAAGASDWGILAASLRSPETRDALAPQDGLYTVVERGPDGDRFRVIGAIRDVLVAPEDPAALVDRMADPAVRIVSLTVTEKGYARGQRRPARSRPSRCPPRSRAWGGAALGPRLHSRRARAPPHRGVPPFAVMSCDNLPANGRTLKRLLVAFAALHDADLAAYVEAEVSCPSTMVDRIVPATTAADRALVAAALGVSDAWPVVTEPYYSWVIEDDFPRRAAGFPHAGRRPRPRYRTL